MSRPSVCLYTESPAPSGVGCHMLALAERLRDRFALSFACPPGPGGTALLGQAHALGLPTLALDRLGALVPFLDAHAPALVHLHAGIGWEGHAGARLAGAWGARVLRTEHLPYLLTDRVQQGDYHLALDAVDRVLCVSEGARRSYAEAGVPDEKLCVVRNGIPEPVAGSDGLGVRHRLGLAPDALVALTVGRFTEQKGYDVLLDSVPAVLDHVPETRFLWVGDGPLWAETSYEVARRGLGEQVLLPGRRSDVPDLMAAADLFVLPSRFEGLPLAVLEALAARLPVVATRVVGTKEAVLDGETGWLVPPENAVALAVTVITALQDAGLRHRRAEAARADFEARWTARRMADDTAAVYDDLLATPPRRSRATFLSLL